LKNSVPYQSSNGDQSDAMIGSPAPEATATATPAAETAHPAQAFVREYVREAQRVELRCQACGFRGEFIEISTG
jgi:hypothetical protein